MMHALYQFIEPLWWLMPTVAVCLLASVAGGISGAYVVARRMNSAAGGIAHIVLGGMGLAFYFEWPLIMGSFIVAIVGALIIGYLSLRGHQQNGMSETTIDTAINALWSASMALGIILMALSPTMPADFTSYLFGNVLLTDWGDALLLSIVVLFLMGLVWLCRRAFLALSFDSEFASTRGVPVAFFHYLLLCMIALAIVAMVRVVGIVLVIALLTVPVAIAGVFTKTLKGWMMLASFINALCSVLGLTIAFIADLPVGATIVLLLGMGYLLVLIGQSINFKMTH